MITARDVDAMAGISKVRAALAEYVFRPANEDDLQTQILAVLLGVGLKVDREVRAERGRYDLLVDFTGRTGTVRLVLELKISGSAAAVERQAQKYALTEGIDLVAIVTTSNRLARGLVANGDQTLGGKPFTVITLRTF